MAQCCQTRDDRNGEGTFMSAMPPFLIVDLAKRYGGADVRVLQLARAFHERDYDYCIATLENSDLHVRLVSENLKHVAVPFGRGNPRTAQFLRKTVSERGIQIVDAHNPQSQLWAHLGTAGLNIRHVSTMHSSYRLEHEGSVKGHAYEQVITLNRTQNTKFIAVVDAVYEYLTETVNLPKNIVTTIPNGIHVSETMPSRQRHVLWDEWGWADDVQVAIAVGRLETVKGHGYLIDAIASLVDKHPKLRCVIVGEGRSEDDLKAQIAAHNLANVVKLAGFRQDIEDLSLSSDFYLMPSLSEGLPYALLEAASLGLPVLVSDVGGMAKLLDHQQTAYLVPPENAEAIAEGLDYLLSNPDKAEQLGQAIYHLVKAEYSLDGMVERTLEIYLSD